MRWVRGASALILVSVLVAGCGGSGDDKDASSKQDDAVAASASKDEGNGSTTTSASVGSDTKSKGTTTIRPGSSGESTATSAPATGSQGEGEPDGSELPSEPLPLSVELSSTCVRPGSSLTVTVKSVPKAVIGYDTTWADGKSGWDAPNRGGSAKGTTDDVGIWKNTVTIGADAPKGRAHVDVIGSDNTGRMGKAAVDYQVSDALGKCS